MLKAAIVGCGKIADEHANQIRRLQNCELVGFCDRELLMARQMQDRFGGVPAFDDITELFRKARPDVVHITTPPQSHFELARRSLDAGCHVYVEKPFTVDANQAAELLRLATERQLKVTVGHNYMFSEPALRMRALVRDGYLGGPPVHMESYYCYDLGDVAYAKAFLGDKHHWLRQLPGGLFQNIISHGVCRIAAHLRSESPTVIAHAFRSPLLKGLGERQLQDELRVIIEDDSATAYFTFSTQIHPQLSQFRLYGTRNALILDDIQHSLVMVNGSKYKSYLEHFVPPISIASQYVGNAVSNVTRFTTGRLHMNGGLRTLVEKFYRSIAHGDPLPIPYSEILLTSVIMDRIFTQIAQSPEVPRTAPAVY